MNNVLADSVLVLNRLWFPVNTTTVEEALKQMYVGAVQALDIRKDGDESSKFLPLSWEEWIKLTVRDGDKAVRSPKLTVRAPTVVIANRYSKSPSSTPKLNSRNVGKLYGYVCQYSGEYDPHGNVDHIVPKDLGGKNTWENVVWSKKSINSMKGNRRNNEVGLPRIKGKRPLASPIPLRVRSVDREDWKHFIPT